MTTQTGIGKGTRIPLSIPITISGKDADGQPFKETARTLIVSSTGGLIAASHKPVKGSQIEIENPALSRTATAQVVWVAERRAAGSSFFELGVKVSGGAYLWPIEFPYALEKEDTRQIMLLERIEKGGGAGRTGLTDPTDLRRTGLRGLPIRQGFRL